MGDAHLSGEQRDDAAAIQSGNGLLFPLQRHRLRGALVAAAVFVVIGLLGAFCMRGTVAAVLSLIAASYFAYVFAFGMARLVSGRPSLIVDDEGFHGRGRTIRWVEFQGLGTDVATGLLRTPVLAVVPSAGKPLRLNEKQFALPIADVIEMVRDWSMEHRGVDPCLGHR